MKFENTKISDKTLELDGNQYLKCEFENCILAYAGGALPNMVDCNFVNATFTFTGAAANTLNVLGALYKGGFQSLVETTFDAIRNNKSPESTPS